MGFRLIGRAAELAALGLLLRRGVGLVLLSGAAGIGKSRLAEEVLAQAGLTRLEGRAHPLHAGLAYAPIVEALRPQLDSITDYSGLADLGRLLADRRLPVAAPLGDQMLERTRMFEAVVSLIQRVGPAVLFIDDVHWADQGTVELLHYVSRSAPVLVTCRTSDVRGPLWELMSAVRQADPTAVLELGPLPDPAVAELARDLLGQDPEPDLLDGVTRRAHGVPLFLTALLQGGVAEAGALPAIVRDVVLARLSRLAEDDRLLLQMIAAAGDSASEQLLTELGLAPGSGIRRLLAEGLITEHPSHYSIGYRVAHPLYAEVAYAELTAGERRKLHTAIAEAVQQRTPDDILALAPHYLQAGDLVDPAVAGAALAEAGWRALLINASDEAVRYLTAALHTTGTDSIRAVDLLDGLGQAHLKSGRIADALAAWSESALRAKRFGLAEKLSSLRFRLALMESERGDLSMAENHALDGSIPIGDVATQNIALRMIYTVRHLGVDRAQVIISQLHGQITPQAPPAALASEELRLELAAILDGDFARAREHALSAVRHGKDCYDTWPVLSNWAMHDLVGLSAILGDVTAALNHAEEAMVMQTRTGISPARSTARLDLNMANYLAGNLAAATKESEVGVELARRTHMPRSLVRALLCRALFLAEQDDPISARACLAEAATITVAHEPGVTALRETAETALAVYAGHPDKAPTLTYWALFHEPLVMATRLLFAWRAGVAQPSYGHGLLLDTLADSVAGKDVADQLAAMGAKLLAAQARVSVGGGSPDSILQSIALFQEAGAKPWTDRARQAARAAGIHVRTTRGTGPLSKRESEVVRLLGEGLSNADIAARLLLSERTVETHLRNSYAKLGMTSRVTLARWAADNA